MKTITVENLIRAIKASQVTNGVDPKVLVAKIMELAVDHEPKVHERDKLVKSVDILGDR